MSEDNTTEEQQEDPRTEFEKKTEDDGREGRD